MGATQTLAEHIASVSFQSLPGEVVEAAKIGIMDGVANMVAGAAQPVARLTADYVRDLGGAPACTVAGRGFRTNAPSAAFANGVSGHCLDFEIQGHPPTHGTSSCLPAALALGEIHGCSGQAIIEAYVLGWEIQGRVREASVRADTEGLHPPGYVGPLGGAVAGAKVLGLSARQIRVAMGIAASRTGGLTANTGTMVKSTHTGNAARMGVEAAMLAHAGLTSNEDVLETSNGYVKALFKDRFDWDVLLGGLGEGYRLVDPGFDIKRFPAQIHMQRSIEAVLDLRERHDVHPDNVASLTIETRDEGHSGPVPKSGLDGKFSIAYCTAAALLDGRVDIDTFTDERRFAPDMEAALRKIKVTPIPQDRVVSRTIATLTDGRTLSAECEWFRGSVGNPMNREQRLRKFSDCATRVLSAADSEALAEQLENLEDVADVSALMSRLAVAE